MHYLELERSDYTNFYVFHIIFSGYLRKQATVVSIGETNFQKPKDGAESALCSNMSTGLVNIYEVKRSQRHLLPTIENSRLVLPIALVFITIDSLSM